jgi:FlaA1/EpsC-like NDP-sugar epimerase
MKKEGKKMSRGMAFRKLATGPLRTPLVAMAYSTVFVVSSIIALAIRFDLNIPPEFLQRWYLTIFWVVALKLLLLLAFGQFQSLLTFFSMPDVRNLILALGASAGLQLAAWFYFQGEGMIPRGTIVVDSILSFLGIICLRMGMGYTRDHILNQKIRTTHQKKIGIIGAGKVGAMLAREIQTKPGLGMQALCYFDDDPRKIGRTLHGLPVVSDRAGMAAAVARMGLVKCIIAMPGASPALISETVSLLNDIGVEHDILPSVDCILSRRVSIGRLRHVSPEDLLGRPPVVLSEESINILLAGAKVLVTGAGGSIGRELCRQIATRKPKVLILLERSEPALFDAQQEILRDYPDVPVQALVANICDENRLDAVFSEFRPEIVFHAAAHKHVPLMESQPSEAIWNNAFGTLFCARAAQHHECSRFVLVSTDKAVDPSSVMGMTKRLAELALSELQADTSFTTKFCSVRFGNVLDSSGSVVPIFRRQIATGGPVTVTHPEVERYFMSIAEAAGLILQSAASCQSGDAFVLDMGVPVRIELLARQMIELQGLQTGRDIQIVYTGLRPGEKLRETPIHPAERVVPGPHPKIRRILTNANSESKVETLETMRWKLHHMEAPAAIAWLRSLLGAYSQPGDSAVSMESTESA